MSGRNPIFSVVIPTYNRAALLPFAVESVLQQTFTDFELVISNGGSSDDTRQVVQRFDDPRIKYVESEQRITAAENYQSGLDVARGEFITFLSDDDAYTPELLDRVRRVITDHHAKIIGYQYCRYYQDELYDFNRKIPANSLLISKSDDGLTKFDSREAIEQVLAVHALDPGPVHERFICPYLSNATYHRSIFDQLNRIRPNLFDEVPADIYLAAAVFFFADAYYCLDSPLLVWKNWEGNATASAQRSQNRLREHYEKLLNGRELTHTPLKYASQVNCGANAVLQAVYELGDGMLRVDWATYFQQTYENFIYLKSVGVDTTAEERDFKDALALQPPEIQEQVKNKQSSPVFRVKAFLNGRTPRIASGLRRILKTKTVSDVKIVRGSDADFTNILEASRKVAHLVAQG